MFLVLRSPFVLLWSLWITMVLWESMVASAAAAAASANSYAARRRFASRSEAPLLGGGGGSSSSSGCGASSSSSLRKACPLYVWNAPSALLHKWCLHLMKDNVYEGRGGVKVRTLHTDHHTHILCGVVVFLFLTEYASCNLFGCLCLFFCFSVCSH